MNSETLHIILVILEVIAALYLILIGLYTFGLFRLKLQQTPSDNEMPTKVSILVAARNEAHNIVQLIERLCNQNYPLNQYEIIIVDDHSEDDTLQIIEQQQLLHPQHNIKVASAKGQGKKDAIRQALHLAQNDWILVTDADCVPSSNWLKSHIAFIGKTACKMILGPVLLSPANTFFERLQVLEHLSLIGSTAGSASIGWPVLCNGANMAYEREAALDIEKSMGGQNLASGDDIFLMQAFIKKYGRKSIQFLYSKDAIVQTRPLRSLSAFFHQRARWTSKTKAYTDLNTILVAAIVALFNLSLVTLFIAAFFLHFLWVFFLLYILLKFLIDFPLLRQMALFTGQYRLVRWIFPLEFVYPFYVVITAFAGLFGKSSWKGRKTR